MSLPTKETKLPFSIMARSPSTVCYCTDKIASVNWNQQSDILPKMKAVFKMWRSNVAWLLFLCELLAWTALSWTSGSSCWDLCIETHMCLPSLESWVICGSSGMEVQVFWEFPPPEVSWKPLDSALCPFSALLLVESSWTLAYLPAGSSRSLSSPGQSLSASKSSDQIALNMHCIPEPVSQF